MYRNMRRKDRAMEPGEAYELLKKGEYGTLSTVGKDNQPYIIPLSYVVEKQTIYFHCALSGQKLDNIAHESKVSFCVVGEVEPVYQNSFSTYFKSVVVFGKASPVQDAQIKTKILMKLADKYLPQHIDKAPEGILKAIALTAVYQISIEHMTGKSKKKEL